MPNYSDPTISSQITSSTPESASFSSPSIILPVLVLVAGLLSLAIALFTYTQVQKAIAENQTNVQAISKQTAQIEVLKKSNNSQIQSFNSLATNLNLLFQNQRDWPVITDSILKQLYKHMSVTGLSIDEKGKVSLSGTVASYTDYAKLYASMYSEDAKNRFSDVRPGPLTINTSADKTTASGLGFSFTFTLLPTIFPPTTVTSGSTSQPAK